MITRVEEILTLAKKRPTKPRLAVVGSESTSVLDVVAAAHEHGLAESILFGDPDKTRQAAEELALDLSPFELVAAETASEAAHLGLARIAEGGADILCKGLVPTRTLIKGMLDKTFSFRTERALSHVGVFNVPAEDRLLIISDAGVNVQPDLSRKRDILLNSVDVAHVLGFGRPRVAILSFVEEVTDPRIGSQQDAADLKQMYLDGSITGCVVEGPYSLDVALSPEAAKIKGVEGEVAGHADIVVMHDIGMGNILYKALLLWCKPVIAAVVMGATVPVVSPSRADSMATKMNSIALATLILDQGRNVP